MKVIGAFLLSAGVVVSASAAMAQEIEYQNYPGPVINQFDVCQAPQVVHVRRNGHLVRGAVRSLDIGPGAGGTTWTYTQHLPVYVPHVHVVQNTFQYLVPTGNGCYNGDPRN